MPPTKNNNPRLRILSVGGNAVSAYLSWRLQATNACDVTLVWKSGFDSVAQYGISFKSSVYGNERFKPRAVVRTPEEAAQMQKAPFDYVILCIKALPDVYDLASVIQPVVTPQHTCILINTSHSLGIEALIEKRFPKNVVLSLVSAADITQLGPAEFEHDGDSQLWVGPANVNPDIPVQIQNDMSEALAMTLGSGQVNCTVSKNIQQQQFERMVGPIAFHTASVLFETPNHAELLELIGVRSLVSDMIDEVLRIAQAWDCSFPANFKQKVLEDMIVSKEANSIMFQDYTARRPMEVETYLGSPLKLAKAKGVSVPRIETLYAVLHHVNAANQKRVDTPAAALQTPSAAQPPPMSMGQGPPMAQGQGGPPRMSQGPPPRGPGMNGHMVGPPPMRGRGSRTPSMNGPPPPLRRGPSAMGMNGYHPMGGPPPMRGPMQRRPSFENPALDEFSHLVLYDQGPDNYDGPGGYPTSPNGTGPPAEFGLRERELMLRQKELALREREMAMRGPGPGARSRPPPSQMGDFDEEEGEDDYFDPMAYRGPPVDPDNIDMMSVTSRRNRKQPSVNQLRHNPEAMGPHGQQRRSNQFAGRPALGGRHRPSSRMVSEGMGGVHENLLDNPLAGSSDRYGGFDRGNLGRESRSSSLTAARLNEMGMGSAGVGGYAPMGRRTSQSPGMPFSPGIVPGGTPGAMGPRNPSPRRDFPPQNGRPSPPDMRQPTPRHPPGHGNSVAPQQVEQHAGVSNLYPPKSGPQVRSLTGSASASAGSGDSGRSANPEPGDSGFSSQSSLGPRPAIGVR